jgi:hypothetical protein
MNVDQLEAGLREVLYLKALNCPHTIEHDKITLHYDPKQSGHNALAQLADRLAEMPALPAAARQGALTDEQIEAFWKKVSGRPLYPGSLVYEFARALLAAGRTG